jgi:hypothetical protein
MQSNCSRVLTYNIDNIYRYTLLLFACITFNKLYNNVFITIELVDLQLPSYSVPKTDLISCIQVHSNFTVIEAGLQA